MKVLHVCYSDLDGGAARAAYRLHQAQLKSGVDSYMLVINKLSTDKRVIAVDKRTKIRVKINSVISNYLTSQLTTQNPVKHSLNFFPSGMPQVINNLAPDIVNLHWIGSDMLSISEVAKLKAPIVWTLHDMWAFSGCEHYDNYPEIARYKNNYQSTQGKFGFDLDAFIYKYKRNKWKNKKITFVSPSQWLADCLQSSVIADRTDIYVIQNCIDHDIYAPVDKTIARELLGLPIDKNLVLFGAMASTTDVRKGFLLLDGALKILGQKYSDKFSLLVFGADKKSSELQHGFETFHLGVFKDDLTLRLLYSAADLYVAPSLQDNLPNTLVEAMAVGTPCVAFKIGGMPDLISDETLGVLVDSIDTEALAKGIELAINRKIQCQVVRDASLTARSETVIAEQYKAVYSNV